MKSFGAKVYAGLDLGTNSIGWAVTDENYELRRAKGKDLWGARLFDEAQTSVDRRGHRTARRRLQREKARIGLLREYFADEIDKVDPGFFLRLEESKYHFEDRSDDNKQKYGLFTGDFTDKDYFNKYPTIFHLRKALLDNEEAPYDVRLVFLALLNMFKHRGNFLHTSLDMSNSNSGLKEAWESFTTESELFCFDFNTSQINEIETVLSDKSISKTVMAERLCKILEIEKKQKAEYELLGLICGKTAKLINIFGEEALDDEHKKLSICFRDSNDEKIMEAQEILGDQYFGLIEAAKEVHDMGYLESIMKGHRYLTYARVESYESHKEDLKILKKVLKKYDEKEYNKMFRAMGNDNYSAYVGTVYSHDKLIRRNGGHGKKPEDLYKRIKSIMAKLPQDDPDVCIIINKIESDNFLPKQMTFANGVIPNQVYVEEMKKILSNAEVYLPFLKEKDESGLSVSQRILEIFKFRIPYYVGPIGQEFADREGYNVWSVRNEKGRVFPWNFEEKIDTKKTAEKFIERMVRHCSYLNDEKTLPKNSLLYEKFMVLNELNNLKIYGEKISVEVKQDVFNTLFMTGKRITTKQIENYFVKKGLVAKGATDFLSGFNVEEGFKASLSTFGKFYAVIGDTAKTEAGQKMIEDIVFWMTVYGDDKSFTKERCKKQVETSSFRQFISSSFRQ